MKVLKRVFAIAISLAAICVATSAFAADATYDAETATIALPEAAIQEIQGMTGQVTMAVVPNNFGSGSNSEDIYYINQGTAADMADKAASIGLKGALSVPANYQVRVGGQDASMVAHNIPAVAFVFEGSQTIVGEDRVGVKGTITVNAGINNLKVLLKDGDVTGSYDWNGINIASANGATFTFGLEIVNNTDDAAKDLSNVTITGVELISAE
jgi:hypothetical protein